MIGPCAGSRWAAWSITFFSPSKEEGCLPPVAIGMCGEMEFCMAITGPTFSKWVGEETQSARTEEGGSECR